MDFDREIRAVRQHVESLREDLQDRLAEAKVALMAHELHKPPYRIPGLIAHPKDNARPVWVAQKALLEAKIQKLQARIDALTDLQRPGRAERLTERRVENGRETHEREPRQRAATQEASQLREFQAKKERDREQVRARG